MSRTLLIVVLAIALPSVAASSRPPLVFGAGGAWTVVARDGRVLMHLREVCGQRAKDLAIGPDERTVVFTAWSAPVENWLLFVCDGGEPRRLGDPTGYHGNPSFSEDGATVFFVHHPKKGGPIGMHEEGANAQLYRVKLDGSHLEALTGSAGCKLAPQNAGQAVVYIHSTCTGARSVELISLAPSRSVATLEKGNTHYPDLSADRRAVLLTRKVLNGVQLISLDVQKMASRVLWSLPEGYEETRAGWGQGEDSIIYQRDGAVWRVSLRPTPHEDQIAVIGGRS